MTLDTLCVCSSDMAEAQKMVHMYPANPCYLSTLVFMLRKSNCELKEKYKTAVLLHGKHSDVFACLRDVLFCC